MRTHFKYFDLILGGFVAVLLCSNLIGVSKVSQIGGFSFGTLAVGPFTFGSAILFFPFSYVFGDILTEVYGYARARRVVWSGFAALLFASFMSWAVLAMPAAPGWQNQAAFETVFGSTWRIVLASLTAFWAGELVNSFVLAKMKVWTSGKYLWARTIGSTIAGEAVDSLIFYPGAFLGVWSFELVQAVMISNFFLKVGWEAMLTPITYQVVKFLKRAEGVDYYDRDTNFTPFKLDDEN